MMVDSKAQGQGFGAIGMRLLIDRIRARGNAKVLLLSYVEGNEAAVRFYKSLGFRATGETLAANEIMMALTFEP